MESDPLGLGGGSYSTYAYVLDSPVGKIDPLGLGPQGAAVGAGIGGAIGGVAGAVVGGAGAGAGCTLVAPGVGTVGCGAVGGAAGAAEGTTAGAAAGAAIGSITEDAANLIQMLLREKHKGDGQSCPKPCKLAQEFVLGQVSPIGGRPQASRICVYQCENGSVFSKTITNNLGCPAAITQNPQTDPGTNPDSGPTGP